ncbi:MAG: hypothetical protein BM485_16890 [Desulfobulbaceae bacterium DB1]|nr:MAG: hypothetical protein BM485_16890 [Desulfobulbaceae bacterium DB1]
MQSKNIPAALLCLVLLAFPFSASGHFLEIIPSTDIVTAGSTQKIDVNLAFSHPGGKERVPEMAAPEQIFVLHGGEKTDLQDLLAPGKLERKSAYGFVASVQNPGDHVFAVAAAPYWDSTEKKLIVQYAKVVVNGFERETGWDEPIRFPVEIDPLVRPYGLWTGNSFRGVVKHNGRPVPFADIEVTYRSRNGEVMIPAEPFRTQVLVADINGVFTYTMPRAGWWGFAALIEGEMVEYEGKRVEVELGGLMWVRCVDMVSR